MFLLRMYLLYSYIIFSNNIDADFGYLFFIFFIFNLQHFGQSPLPAYEPAFDWENERSLIFGQRIPETPITQYGSCEMFL